KNDDYGNKSPHQPGMFPRTRTFIEKKHHPAGNDQLYDKQQDCRGQNNHSLLPSVLYIPVRSTVSCLKNRFLTVPRWTINRPWRGGRKGSLENRDYTAV